jgi:protocatechuate 3,4-dioxygenase beta subunit
VDIWHCDADGIYSGFTGQLGGLDTTGQQFLRGAQITNAEGLAVFRSIYPGWYPGRTTHIHFKVRPTPSTEATSQLYFPEDVNALVYAGAPYDVRGQKDTSNEADAIGRNTPLAVVTPTDDGYEARLTVTIP